MATKLLEIPNQIAVEGIAFSFTIPNGTFSTSGTTQYRFEIQRRVRNCTLRRCLDASENWLYSAGNIIYGTPTNFDHYQSLQIEVTCLDADGPAYAIFNLTAVNNDFVGTRKAMVRSDQVFDHTLTSANIGTYDFGTISSGDFVKIAASVGNPSAGNTTSIDTARTAGAIICWEIDNTNKNTLDYGKVKSFDTIGLTHALYRWEPGKTGNSIVGESGAPIYITNLDQIITVDDGTIAGNVQNAASMGIQGTSSYWIMCGQGTHADPYGIKTTNTSQPCFQITDEGNKRYDMEVAYVEIPQTKGIGFHFKDDVTYTTHTFNTITDAAGKIKITINGVDKTANFPVKTNQQSIVFHTTIAGYDQRGKITASVFTGGNTELTLDEAYVADAAGGTIYELFGERPDADWDGLKVHDNYIHDCRNEGVGTGGEAMYIGKGFGEGYNLVLPGGRLVYPHDLRNVRCMWNIMERAGWDVWQARNIVDPTSKHKYNFAKDSGMGGFATWEAAITAQETDPSNPLLTPTAQTQGMDWGNWTLGEFAYNYIENVMNVGIFYNFAGESYIHHNIVYNVRGNPLYSANGLRVDTLLKGVVSNTTERIAGNLTKGYAYNNTFVTGGTSISSFASLDCNYTNNIIVNCNANGFTGNIASSSFTNFTLNNNLFLELTDINGLFVNPGKKDFRIIAGTDPDNGGIVFTTNVVQGNDFGGRICSSRSTYAVGAFEVDSYYNYNLYHIALNIPSTDTEVRWYRADDAIGTNEFEIGHGELEFTPNSAGFYRCGVTPKASTGDVNGLESFSSYIEIA